MPFELNLDPSDLIIDRYIPDIRPIFPRPAKVRILIVLEPGISPGPPGSGFGLGRVVSYLRNETFGFVDFEVDFALRGTDDSPTAVDIDNGAGEWDFRYRDFRYHSVEDGTPILHGYDELWCFGINPNIHDNGDNQSVKDSNYSSTPAELTVLTEWMDNGGGVLAMGDHNFLGSAMCWNIPRVGTMRAWLKDDNDGRSVPNRTGTDRHDTNRPQNASQDATQTPNPAMIPNSVERDAIAQPLEWKKYSVWSRLVFQRRRRPHPVLCGGSLGVIDRFPDHPHEGLVIHEDLIDFTAKCLHDNSKDEYPTVDGQQPTAEAIAWVRTLPDPPYNLAKGDQPARRFPAIGVYNGHSIDHGRVLVDSTWHHWFDMNIAQLEASDSEDFQKIKRYFQNVAIWLAPKHEQQKMLNYGAFWTVLANPSFEELTLDTPIFTLGGQAIDILGRATSDCLVTDWLLEFIPRPIHDLFRPRKPFPIPDPCWSCPPEELISQAVMGGVIRELLPYRDKLIEKSWGRKKVDIAFKPDEIEQTILVGVFHGIEALMKTVDENHEAMNRLSKLSREAFEASLKTLKVRRR